MSPFSVPTTNVPPIVFTPQGLTIPTDTDILAGVQEDMNTAFGGGLNPQLSTPQGQLASSQAAIISDKDSEIALICNQVDPQYATGRFQDAIARIYFLERDPASATVVLCIVVGAIGAVIPAGTLAQDTNSNTYALTAAVTIPSSGSTTAQFQNIVTGPIPCLSGTLTKVFQAVDGFDAISNPSDGTLGQNVETPAAFEFRRQQSVAINGVGTVPSIYGNVFAVSGVLDAYAIDNPSGLTVESGSTNYPLAPHSLYVAVLGGDAAAIAQAIWNKKDTGCDYSAHPVGQSAVPGEGSVVTENVTDPSGYSFPQPSYQVSYIIPGALPIFFAVSIINLPSLPSNIVALIQAAIIAQFSGTNGAVMARIGSLILATSFFGPVAASAPNVLIVSVAVGTAANPTDATVQVGIDQTPTISAANIVVTLT